MSDARRLDWFGRLPTPLKILIIISLALLPLGLASAWMTKRNLDASNAAIEARTRDQGIAASEAMQSLLARNTLAVKIAANSALPRQTVDPCAEVQRILAVSPAVGREFELLDPSGKRLCAVGPFGANPVEAPVAPGELAFRVAGDGRSMLVRAGVIGGAATVRVTKEELAKALEKSGEELQGAELIANGQSLQVLDAGTSGDYRIVDLQLADRRLNAKLTIARRPITALDRLLIFLPVLMWAAAAIVSWWAAHRFLIRPLRRLQAAVVSYEPSMGSTLELPASLGPATEIRELGEAFQRTVDRVELAEHDARGALEGQRRLVREVHHRVKNNLQVVASLLSIHGRNAADKQAQAAYSAIGRRVDALSVVHRNHFAELEDNRGIAMRPLLTELTAGLRASAPAEARSLSFDLEADSVSTTQDVAVAAAFLITEIVEYSMLRRPEQGIRISLRRTDELTASLSIESAVLVPDDQDDDVGKTQFERIVEGLARQLRSPLERRLGRYGVTLPIFPDA